LCRREENSLVDMFVFELLVTYIESLVLAHADEKVLGTFHPWFIIHSFALALLLILLLLFFTRCMLHVIVVCEFYNLGMKKWLLDL
jgi:hypothetical protein